MGMLTSGGSMGAIAGRSRGLAAQVIPVSRVTAHALAERARHIRAAAVGDVPVDPGEITPAWLTAVLCRSHPGVSVIAFESQPVPTGTSTRWTMTVEYDADPSERGLPTRLFAKSTRDLRQRILMGISETIAGEATFYGSYRQDLEIEAPYGYHGACRADTWRSIVLMEDVVTTKGAQFLNAAATVTCEQAADLLANLASLHGSMWDDPRLRDLPTPADIGRVFSTYTDMHARYRSGTRRASSVIPDELAGRHDALHRRLQAALDKASTGPQTLIHGDAHIGNTYRTAADAMGYGDWQVVRRGSWAFDVAMTVVTGLTVDDRRAWERDLLSTYLDHLAAAGGPRLDLDTAFDLYRDQVVYPYLAWLCTIGRGALQPRMQPDDICRLVIQRAGAAVSDLL